MGIFLMLMILGVVCWIAWVTLKNEVKMERVSRDMEDTLTDKMVEEMQRKVEEWKKQGTS